MRCMSRSPLAAIQQFHACALKFQLPDPMHAMQSLHSADLTPQTAFHQEQQGSALNCVAEAPAQGEDEPHSSEGSPKGPEYEAPVTVAEVGLTPVRARLPQADDQQPDVASTHMAEADDQPPSVPPIGTNLCNLPEEWPKTSHSQPSARHNKLANKRSCRRNTQSEAERDPRSRVLNSFEVGSRASKSEACVQPEAELDPLSGVMRCFEVGRASNTGAHVQLAPRRKVAGGQQGWLTAEDTDQKKRKGSRQHKRGSRGKRYNGGPRNGKRR
jgi:hypothetical protein